jgi:hypothetical protein
VIEQRGSELGQRGDHKARIGTVFVHFCFHDDVPGLRPALGGIGKSRKVLHWLFGCVKPPTGFSYGRCAGAQ